MRVSANVNWTTATSIETMYVGQCDIRHSVFPTTAILFTQLNFNFGKKFKNDESFLEQQQKHRWRKRKSIFRWASVSTTTSIQEANLFRIRWMCWLFGHVHVLEIFMDMVNAFAFYPFRDWNTADTDPWFSLLKNWENPDGTQLSWITPSCDCVLNTFMHIRLLRKHGYVGLSCCDTTPDCSCFSLIRFLQTFKEINSSWHLKVQCLNLKDFPSSHYFSYSRRKIYVHSFSWPSLFRFWSQIRHLFNVQT